MKPLWLKKYRIACYFSHLHVSHNDNKLDVGQTLTSPLWCGGAVDVCLIVLSMFYGSTMRQTAIRGDAAEIVKKEQISRSATDPVSVCCTNTNVFRL